MLPDDLRELAVELDELGGVVSPDEAAPDLSGTDFALERPIGSGGMGVVYAARQISLDRAVAVKVIRTDGRRDDGFRARFEAEAKLVARLHHPNIVGVHAAGAAANHVWYAMELVSGETAVVHRFPDVRALAAFGLVVAEALDYAHRCGVVHRDVKPENVFIGDDGCVKLGDFGLAQLGVGAANGGGTRRYMAPETLERGEAGALSDQYALGLTLLELAAEVGGYRKRDFAAILDRMTAHEPGGRYPDMAGVAADLRRFLEHRPLRTVRNSPFHLFGLLTKRNPAAAWGGLLAAALAAGLALSLLVGYARTSAALGKADEALRQVEREAASAARALASSLTVLDRSDPDKRETQLRTAIESVKALARRYPKNPEIRAVLGRLRYAVEAHRRKKAAQ